MKIGRLKIKNVTSYRAESEFIFDSQLNILIGPNGGGKSNLQRIVAVVLTQFFVRQYQVRNADNATTLEPFELYNRRVLADTLSKFHGDDTLQLIEIDIIPEDSDIENIRMISTHLDRFNEHLDIFDRKYERFNPAAHVEQIKSA